MADKKIRLTREGLKEREEKLEYLKSVRRTEIAQKIKEAREQGDLSENAEYDAAKDEQRDIEAEIEELEKTIKNAEIVEEETDKTIVSVGSHVTLLDYDTNKEVEYFIKTSSEANILENRISDESPVGSALIGKRAGDEIEVETLSGILKFKVISTDRD